VLRTTKEQNYDKMKLLFAFVISQLAGQSANSFLKTNYHFCKSNDYVVPIALIYLVFLFLLSVKLRVTLEEVDLKNFKLIFDDFEGSSADLSLPSSVAGTHDRHPTLATS